MIDPASQAILREIVRRESRSLLRYIGDSFPWTTTEGGPALRELGKLVQEESGAVADLGRYLVRQRITLPFLGSYPAAFTSCNFIALDFLMPRLLEAQQRSLAQLQADLGQIHDRPAREQVEALSAIKKKTLTGLERLASTSPTPSTA